MSAIFNSWFPLPLSIILLVGHVLGTPSALAEEPVRTETVKFSDLNLDTEEGVRALFGRIHQAAKRVCDEHESDPIRGAIEAACFRQSEMDAVNKLNLPKLTAFYNDRGKSKSRNTQLVAAR